MPVCVLVLKDWSDAASLQTKLKAQALPLLQSVLVPPEGGDGQLPDEGDGATGLQSELIDRVELLNPNLARQRRQRGMARWLMPFGFLAGLTFTQITTLETFSALGPWAQPMIGGLLGMGSGLMGSYAAAASVPSDNEDGVRILRNRHQEKRWLLLLETPTGVEPPWQLLQSARPIQVVRLSEL
ncbi:MAG: hypothetical protein EBZ24_11480 [Synechococcaceae bacterium WB9_4xB_025]|jgi:hypothetical protein|nr:hypothetical protein [Synechococcaceae bacterium WB9_4xB_025]